MASKKWIKGAVRKSGALHRALGIPAGRRIPLSKLKWAAVQPGKLGRRARLALLFRTFRKKRRR